MKCLQVVFLVIMACIGFSNAADSSNDCPVIDLLQCYSKATANTAEVECHNDKACPDSVIDKLENCSLDSILNVDTSKNPLLALLNKATEAAAMNLGFVCLKAGGDYCFDLLNENIKKQATNITAEERKKLTDEIACGECGEKIVDIYKKKLSEIKVEEVNSTYYKQLQEQIENYEVCNGSLSSYIIKLANMLAITIFVAFLLH